MNRLLDVVGLHVWNVPDIGRVLAQGIAGKLSFSWPLEVLLVGIFLRYTYRIKVERVVVPFGKPQDNLVAAGKAFRRVKAVLEVPDDAISQVQAAGGEDRKQHDVQ